MLIVIDKRLDDVKSIVDKTNAEVQPFDIIFTIKKRYLKYGITKPPYSTEIKEDPNTLYLYILFENNPVKDLSGYDSKLNILLKNIKQYSNTPTYRVLNGYFIFKANEI